MKRAKDLFVCLIVMFAGVILTFLGFLFVYQSNCANIIGGSGALAIFSWSGLGNAFSDSLTRLFTFTDVKYWFSGVPWIIFFIGLGVLVTSICISFTKKKEQIIGYAIAELLVAFMFYFIFSIFESINYNNGNQFTTNFQQLLMFDGGKIGGSIFCYIMMIGLFLSAITYFWIFILTLTQPKKIKNVFIGNISSSTTTAKDISNEELLKMTSEVGKNEEKNEPKREVLLTVKRYDYYGNSKSIEEKETKYPKDNLEVKPLTKNDIREVLKEELDKKENNSNITNQDEVIKKPDIDAISTSGDIEEESSDLPTPIIITIPKSFEETEDKSTLSNEDIRRIVHEEISNAISALNTKDNNNEEDLKIEVDENIIKENDPLYKKDIKEEDVDTSVVTLVNEETNIEDIKKNIRTPFATKIKTTSEVNKNNYNELKSLLISFGLKSRLSSTGDVFRLHRVTYCKLAFAGKGLKIFLALDPKDYADSTIPIRDASSKEIYKEIPSVFKVKSSLSLKRAKELIFDCMVKHGIEQIDNVKVIDWVANINNKEMSGGSENEKQ